MNIVTGTHRAAMSVPEWWVEKHRKLNEDIIFVRNDGTPFSSSRTGSRIINWQYILNYWHPLVKELIYEQFSPFGRLVKGSSAADMLILSAEGTIMLPDRQRGVTEPSGLQYEFRKFMHGGYNEWLGSETEVLNRYAPGHPTAVDMQNTFGGSVDHAAHDPVGFFRAANIRLYLTYQGWDRKFVGRWNYTSWALPWISRGGLMNG